MARSSSRSSNSRKPTRAVVRAPWAWAVAGVLAGSVPALTVFAPAAWMASAIERATQGQVMLNQARGTVWTGSAQLVLTGGQQSQDRAALPGRLHWQLRPAWDGLMARIEADCCTTQPLVARIQLSPSSQRITLADGRSRWPAALLSGLGTPWNTLQPHGQLALETRALTAVWAAGRLSLSGSAQMDALDMSSRLSTLRPMGSYRLQLQGGDAPGLTLSTLSGPLQLSGTGQWVGQRLRFNGEASAAPEREAALANLLNIIGRRNGARSLISVG